MRSATEADGRLTIALDALAATDVGALDDQRLRTELLDLLADTNRLHAEVLRRLDAFDRRGLSMLDGFRTAKAWLQAFGRLSGGAAQRLVKAARLLRRLPKLAHAAAAGGIPAEQVQQVARLADQVGAEQVAQVDATLAEAGQVLDAGGLATVLARVRAHLDPDGPDPARDFENRSVTLSPVQGRMLVHGQLDAEGGAALATALDALMTPPGEGDDRTAGQRRADALVELARLTLANGSLPSVGGQRPQVGVLLYPQSLSPRTLAMLAELHKNDAAGVRLQEWLAKTYPDPAPAAQPAATAAPAATATATPADTDDPADPAGPAGPAGRPGAGCPAADPAADPAVAGACGSNGDPPQPPPDSTAASPPPWSRAGWADPPWLNWHGPISPIIAQRIACDADVWRLVIDPVSGMPLDLGRSHRLVPAWLRKALHARDGGCRWLGCTAPPEWSDAHHLDPWAEHGLTDIERLLLLCRWHHGLVHEGGWHIDLDPDTGHVTITRPDGTPYQLR